LYQSREKKCVLGSEAEKRQFLLVTINCELNTMSLLLLVRQRQRYETKSMALEHAGCNRRNNGHQNTQKGFITSANMFITLYQKTHSQSKLAIRLSEEVRKRNNCFKPSI
jgi:hypothetical protein